MQLKNKNKILYIIILVILLLINIRVPYVVERTGGTIDLGSRISIEDTSTNGSISMAYVNQIRANVGLYLFSKVYSKYDLYPLEDTIEKEDNQDLANKIQLDESKNNAILYAYLKAGKEAIITNEQVYVIYIDDRANTTLEVGDELLSVNGLEFKDYNELSDLINNYDNITFSVKKDNAIYERSATKVTIGDTELIGISISRVYDLETNPEIKLFFEDNESGPSGGLMMSLDIYDRLTDYDYIKGRNIVGTGTIDINGIVGAISGIKQKLNGSEGDIFFVPINNLEEALEVQEKYDIDIDIVGVNTFDEVIAYLKNTK